MPNPGMTLKYDLGSYSVRLTNGFPYKIILKNICFLFPEHGAIWYWLGDVRCCAGGTIRGSSPGNWMPLDSLYYGSYSVHDNSLGIIWIIWQRHLYNNGSVYWKAKSNTRGAWDITISCKRSNGRKLNSWEDRSPKHLWWNVCIWSVLRKSFKQV